MVLQISLSIVFWYTADFSDIVKDTVLIGGRSSQPNKLRIHLIDRSFLDVWLSDEDDYSFHWEQRAVRGLIHRWDNAPDHPEIETFPHHFHDGKDSNVKSSRLNRESIDAFKEVLGFIRNKLKKYEKIDIKCVVCASKTEEAKDLIITSTVQGREIVITGLAGTRCSECGEQYVDAESSRRALKIANKFRKPAIVFKRKVTVSGGRRVIGIPEEIDRALGKKENVDIWLEGNKIVAEIY